MTVPMAQHSQKQRIQLDRSREYTLGRYPEHHFRFEDPAVSRNHGRIYHRNGVWIYEDTSSAGTVLVRSKGQEQLVTLLRKGEALTYETSLMSGNGKLVGAARMNAFRLEDRVKIYPAGNVREIKSLFSNKVLVDMREHTWLLYEHETIRY